MVSESKIVMGMDAIIADRARRCGRQRDCSVVSPLAVARSVQFSIQELTFPL
jgi:hypothetical protein